MFEFMWRFALVWIIVTALIAYVLIAAMLVVVGSIDKFRYAVAGLLMITALIAAMVAFP